MVGIKDVWGVGIEVSYLYSIQIDEWVSCCYRSCVVWGRAVVDNVCIKSSVLEKRQGSYEYTVRISKERENWTFCVSEGIDGEELATRGGECAGAKGVPQLTVVAS